jgi:pyruvate,water dikinase
VDVGSARFIRFFEEIGNDDVPLVGGKNASLGEMYTKLSDQGVRVPNGFAITAEAYRYMLDVAGAFGQLHGVLDDLDITDVADLARRGKQAREIVYGAGIPDDREILGSDRAVGDEPGRKLGDRRGPDRKLRRYLNVRLGRVDVQPVSRSVMSGIRPLKT